MEKRGSTGILIESDGHCHIDNCEFRGFDTAVDIRRGDRHRVTSSRFGDNKTGVGVRGGVGHTIADNVFEGKVPPSQRQGLSLIRRRLSLSDKVPDREILASLHAVLREHGEESKRYAARKTTLGKWLIEHGSDVNTAVNTVVTLATAVAQWFK